MEVWWKAIHKASTFAVRLLPNIFTNLILCCRSHSHSPRIRVQSLNTVTTVKMDNDDLDFELQLLAKDAGHLSIGDHELATSPLISRDAANISDFPQRGLLGRVLSLHSEELPEGTNDPRLYMNLAAPASGLVCGVQVSKF